MNDYIAKNIKYLILKALLVLLVMFLFPKTSLANDVFRITEYKVTSFSGTTYNLNLNNDLSSNHFILIRGSESGNVVKSPTNSYVRISKLPSGANKNLPTTGSTRLMELKRYASGSSNWIGVVTVVECLADCDINGFKTLDILDFSTPGYTSTTARVQSGTVSSGSSWTDMNKVVLFGGAFGAGSNVENINANSGYYNSAWLRLYPSGTSTVNWQRYNTSNTNTLSQASHNVYVIQFGSAWTVQRVNVSGSAGSTNGNTTSAYNTATINSVTRAKTWVWGTGYSQAASVGNGSEGILVTLGNGVAKNTTETKVAVGSQNTTTRSFDVYVMSHPSLSVDYQFKTNTSAGVQNFNMTTSSASDSLSRFAWTTRGMSDITNIYPAPIVTGRYTSNTNIALEREYYPATSSAYTSWVQGVYTKSIQYAPTPTLNQDHYYFRDDTKNLNESNGFIGAKNTNPSLFSKNINYRVRFAVSNSGEADTTSGRSFKMQYGLKTTSNCSDISTWTDLSSATSISTSDSTLYANQDTTSMLFSGYGVYNFSNGYGVDSVNLTSPLALQSNRFTELEYSFKISNSISDGKYCLRLYNSTDAKPFNIYSVYPEINVGNYFVQDYYRWYQNTNLVNPITPISSENTECYASIGDQARLRLNLQSQFVPFNPSQKQFKIQYSKNSSAGPWSDVGATSTITNWWSTNYSNRKKINFGTNHSLLPAGYTVSLNTNTQIGLPSGDDIRIVFQKNTGENIELDRIADAWNSATSKLEFKLQTEILANANEAIAGSYYFYYGNSNAMNPPINKNNVYAVYDDFNDSKLRSDWKFIDNDKAQNTNIAEVNGSLSINAGGIDTWETTTTKYDDYASVYQQAVAGDFEVTVKVLSQDNIGNNGNEGIMIKNDITKTQPNSGGFTAMTTISDAYISTWDTNNNGYMDAFNISTAGTMRWPSCLRIKKTGTTMVSSYSTSCTEGTYINIKTQSIPTALASQDVGMYVLSSTGESMSLGKFNFFKLTKNITTPPVITFSTLETKNDWEFYDNTALAATQNIVQTLLSNSNIPESYSEINPTSLNPNSINIDQRGEYDFSFIAKNASKGQYYFRVVKSDNSILDVYNRYPKISIGNYLELSSYKWYQNINAVNPIVPISLENSETTINSFHNPLRLRINIKNSYKSLGLNSEGFILQYSKASLGHWFDVGAGSEWEFYDNSLIASNSFIGSSLLSNSTTNELYSEQNPTIQNPNALSDGQYGEYDFSLIPKNAGDGRYYFRVVKSSNRQEIDSYEKYPSIVLDTRARTNQYSYKIFDNVDSVNAGGQLGGQNSPASVKVNSGFRLKMLMSVSVNPLKQNKYFKLEYAQKGTGTCASPQFPYSIITAGATSGIVFNDNASILDNASLQAAQDSVLHDGVNIIKQTYKEQGDFGSTISEIFPGEDGLWDFSLKENNQGTGKTYCFRMVNEDESPLDAYTYYPEVNITAGVLVVDVVDRDGNIVENPVFNFSSVIPSTTLQTSTALLGDDTQRIRVINTTNNKLWTVSLAPSGGSSEKWLSSDGLNDYDFNSPENNNGVMIVKPSSGVIIPEPGRTTSGINLGSDATFRKNLVDSITLATSSNGEVNTYLDIKNINLSQIIPANQPSGEYSINMTLTVIGN